MLLPIDFTLGGSWFFLGAVRVQGRVLLRRLVYFILGSWHFGSLQSSCVDRRIIHGRHLCGQLLGCCHVLLVACHLTRWNGLLDSRLQFNQAGLSSGCHADLLEITFLLVLTAVQMVLTVFQGLQVVPAAQFAWFCERGDLWRIGQ